MATRSDHLIKVGQETFEILEEYLGKKGRATRGYYQRPVQNNQPKKEQVVDSTQVAKAYGGALFVGYSTARGRFATSTTKM